jgi:hypothetical protein
MVLRKFSKCPATGEWTLIRMTSTLREDGLIRHWWSNKDDFAYIHATVLEWSHEDVQKFDDYLTTFGYGEEGDVIVSEDGLTKWDILFGHRDEYAQAFKDCFKATKIVN